MECDGHGLCRVLYYGGKEAKYNNYHDISKVAIDRFWVCPYATCLGHPNKISVGALLACYIPGLESGKLRRMS